MSPDPKKLVHTCMKVFITMLSVSIALTSMYGLITMVNISSQSEDFILLDPDAATINFGPECNFSYTFVVNVPEGFDFEEFEVTLIIHLQNTTTNETFEILDKKSESMVLKAGLTNEVTIEADNASFTTQELLNNMGNIWHDPRVWNNYTSPSSPNIALEEINGYIPGFTYDLSLSSLYVFKHYNILIDMEIESLYNLGLIEFSSSFSGELNYDEKFGGYPYTYDEIIDNTIQLYNATGP